MNQICAVDKFALSSDNSTRYIGRKPTGGNNVFAPHGGQSNLKNPYLYSVSVTRTNTQFKARAIANTNVVAHALDKDLTHDKGHKI
jgi:hypothetical protein